MNISKDSLNLDISETKGFYNVLMLFLACFKVGRYLESNINLFKYKYVFHQAWSTITPTKFGLLVGP